MTYIRIQKHLSASHITAALGGKFVAGPSNIAAIKRQRSSNVPVASRRPPLDMVPSVLRIPEAIEFLLSELLRTEPLKLLDVVDASALASFVTSADTRQLRTEMLDRMEDLAVLAWKNNLTSPDVADFRRLLAEYQKKLVALEKSSKGAFAGVGGAVGCVFGGVWGAAIGSVIASFLDDISTDVAHAVAKACWRRHHLVFEYVGSLRESKEVAAGR